MSSSNNHMAALWRKLESVQSKHGKQRGTVGGAVLDHTARSQIIQENGNKPEEWLNYTRFIQSGVEFSNADNRHNFLCNVYDMALKTMPVDENKRNIAYATMLIEYAKVKSEYSIDDCRALFNHARAHMRRFAIVHVSAAEFELKEGEVSKCKKILEKARWFDAQPNSLLQKAMESFSDGKTKLLSDEELESYFKSESLSDKSGSTSSQDSTGDFSFPSNIGKPLLTIPSNKFLKLPDGAVLSEGQKLNESYTKEKFSLDGSEIEPMDTNTAPFPVQGDHAEHEPSAPPASCSKPPFRSYHSTPDVKQFKFEQKPARLKCDMKMPRRVKKLEIPIVLSEEESDEDENSFRDIKPLEDITAECNNATVASESMDQSHAGHTSGYVSSMSLNSHTKSYILPHMRPSPISELKSKPEQIHFKSELGHLQKENNVNQSSATDVKASAVSASVCSSFIKRPSPSVRINSSLQTIEKPFAIPVMESALSQETPATCLSVPPNTANTARDIGQKCQPVRSATPQSNSVRQNECLATSSGSSSEVQSKTRPQPSFRKPTSEPGPVSSQPVFATPSNHGANVVANPASLQFTPSMKSVQEICVNGRSYSVLKIVGRGGSSKVYHCIDFEKQQTVGIKMVDLSDADDSIIKGYKNEITLLKRLQYSDKVIKMYDYEHNVGFCCLFIVMELGDTDLASLFRNANKTKDITESLMKYYWEAMLKAVQVLHREGIIHSDLKPANFMLVKGQLKLIDFGIAYAIQQDRTSVLRDSLVGTLNYMSPEAILDSCGGISPDGQSQPRYKIGVKSDVWSLGCILYTMVYGQTPFQSITKHFLKYQAIVSPSYQIQFKEIQDKNLMDVMKRCLIRDVKQRPSIDELLDHPYLKRKTENLWAQLQLAVGNSPGKIRELEDVLEKLKESKPP